MMPYVVNQQGQKWQQGELDRQVTEPTVPGEDSEDKKRGGEGSRKCKTPKCLFQGWIKGDLDKGENNKPADNREDLLFNGQGYPLR